jgi:uncharacterized protein
MAVQVPLRNWLTRRSQGGDGSGIWGEAGVVLSVFLASIYGGYFGAGLSVIVIAVLALVLEGPLNRLNALKQVVAFCVNIAAAVFFLFSGKIVWWAMGVMAVGALVGGSLGGRLAGNIRPALLRGIVVTVGFAIAMIYFWY